MHYSTQNVDLSMHSFRILGGEFQFFDDLDGDAFSGGDVEAEVDFAVRPVANGFA